MKMTFRFTIFLISAIIFSFMLNVANAGSDDDTKETPETNGNVQANGNSNVVEMIQTGEDITAITGDEEKSPTSELINFRDQYKNTDVKLLDFEIKIGNLLKIYYEKEFKPVKAEWLRIYGPQNNHQLSATTHHKLEKNEDKYANFKLIDDMADRILETCRQVRADQACSNNVVEYPGPIRGMDNKVTTNEKFLEACGNPITNITDNPDTK